MEKTGKNKTYRFILALGVLIPLIHFILCQLRPDIFHISIKILVTIYVFIAGFTLMHLIITRSLLKKWPKHAGLLITVMSFVKMMLSLLVLIFIIFPLAGKNSSIALQFTFVYFFFLVIESILITQILIPSLKKQYPTN
jgi:hypothetical protein